MNKKFIKNVDWSIIICVLLLITIGCVALYSATSSTGHEELFKQLIWLAISIPIMMVFVFVDYELIMKIAPIIYLIMIVLLVRSFVYNSNKWSY